MKKGLSFFSLLLVIVSLVSCGETKYEVSFYLNGGTGEVLTQSLKKGEYATEPEPPEKSGFVFKGWFLDDKKYDFNLAVTKNLNLVATWGYEVENLKYYEYLSDSNPVVTIKVKDFGEIHLQLFFNVAENTVNNFLNYVEEGKYDGTVFHRIIKSFMIQGGGMNSTNKPIKGDFSSNGVTNNLKHYRGVISMARTAVKNSATSQFFIVHETSSHLDGEYAAFGAVVNGFDCLDKIANVQTNPYDAPLVEIVIESIKVNLNGYVPKAVIYA